MFGIVLFPWNSKGNKTWELRVEEKRVLIFTTPHFLNNQKCIKRRKSYALIGTYRLKTWKRKFVKLKNGFCLLLLLKIIIFFLLLLMPLSCLNPNRIIIENDFLSTLLVITRHKKKGSLLKIQYCYFLWWKIMGRKSKKEKKQQQK